MAYHPRTFTNSNHAARGSQASLATQAPRWHFRTFTNSGSDFRDRSRDQSWTQAPSARSFQNRTGPQRYPNSGRPRGGNGYARVPRRSQRVVTANDQFGLIISLVFEICQLRHHANNWIELPKSIDSNIDNLFHSINLPRPNDDLTNQKIVLKNLLKHDLQEAAQTHIQSQLDKALNKIKLIDPTDKDKCKHIVRNKLTREIPRINRVNLESWIDECLSLIGIQHTRAPRLYSDALQHNIERTQNKKTNAKQISSTANAQRNGLNSLDDLSLGDNTLVKRPYTPVKRRLPVSPPIQIRNRFDALRDLETGSPMKVRKLTVDEAVHVPQFTCIRNSCKPTRKVSGTAMEVQAAADTEAAAARVVSFTVETVGAGLTDAGDAGVTEMTGVTAELTAVAAADRSGAASAGASATDTTVTAAVTEGTGVSDTATDATTAGLAATATDTEATETTGLTDAVTVGTDTATAGNTEDVARATGVTTAGTADAVSTVIDHAAAVADCRWSASQENRRSSGSWNMRRTQSQTTLDGIFLFGKNSGTAKPGKKFVHENWDKNSETLQVRSKAANIILADSNFRHWQPENENFEVHVYPGANFVHAHRLLQLAQIPDSVLNLIICVGVNHRTWDFSVSTEPEFRKLIAATKVLKQRVYFLGVSAPDLIPFENDNITRVNNYAREKFGNRFFIPPLPRDEVGIRPKDLFKIHHDDDTMRRVFSSIINQVSALPLN